MNPVRKLTISLVVLFVIASCQLINDYRYRDYKGKVARSISADLLEKLKAGKYEEVEDYLAYLVDKKPYSNNGTRLLEEIYLNLAERRDIKTILDDWCASTDNHHSPFIVRGLFHIQDAWRARGGDFAYTVAEQGRRLFRERLALAREDLTLACQLNPKDPNSAGSMITVCMGLRFDEAEMEDWFSIAVDADPMSFYPYLNKLTYLSPKWRGSQEKYSRFAGECYQSSLEGGIVYAVVFDYLTESARISRNKKAFFENKNVKAALDSIFHRWISAFPNSTYVRVDQAYIQYYIGNKQNAINYCDKALKIDPACLKALDLRAMAYYGFGDKNGFERAEKDFRKILEIDSLYEKAAFMLGRIAMNHHKDYEKAIEYLDKAISLNEKNKQYYFCRAKAKALSSHYQAAIDDLTDALTIDPKYHLAYHARADCYRKLDQHEKAEEDLRMGKELLREEKTKDFLASLAQGNVEKYVQSNHFIDLSLLKEIPLELAQYLSKHRGFLKLNGIENLAPEIAELLSKQTGNLQLNGLKSITPEVAGHLSNHRSSLFLEGLSEITPEIARILGRYNGHLTLNGLKSITPEVATRLVTVKRGSLTLDGLETITPEIARCLIRLQDRLILRGVTSVSTQAAIELGKGKGGIELSGLKSMTPEKARHLAKSKGYLSLNGLEELTPELAACLSKHKGTLTLGGLKSITPEVARHLSKHEGTLYLSGLKDIQPEVSTYLNQHKGRVHTRR